MDYDFDCLVVGAGVVGLASAAALAAGGNSVVVVDGEAQIGAGISSRNSEVVHAGLYYATGSLKHRLCIEGRRRLYAFCDETGVTYRKHGKIVVATNADEQGAIEALADRARQNGVEGSRLLTRAEVAALEPEVTAVAGLLSPETGILDSHGYMLALEARIEAGGGAVVLNTPFEGAEILEGGFRVQTGGDDPASFAVRRLVNAAGLSAPAVAGLVDGLAPTHIPELRFARGCYFGLTGRAPFRHLVYPAPVDGGLGVHATLDMAGRVRFGPDVEWLPQGTPEAALDYRVDPGRAQAFYAAVRRYWPALPDGALFPDYAGIRPKLSAPGEPAADFHIQTAAEHTVPGLVNLFGIESPGLTASLAIADRVAAALA